MVGPTDLVNINDKGVLTGVALSCALYTADTDVRITVTIDGVALLATPKLFHVTAKGDSYSLDFNNRFDTSLRIQIELDAANITVLAGASYTID